MIYLGYILNLCNILVDMMEETQCNLVGKYKQLGRLPLDIENLVHMVKDCTEVVSVWLIFRIVRNFI